jgi:hypothetical protein
VLQRGAMQACLEEQRQAARAAETRLKEQLREAAARVQVGIYA